MKTRHILLLTLSAAVLAACGPTIGELKPEDNLVFDYFDRSSGFKGLQINVNSTETTLEISKPGSKACANNIRGCLRIRRGHRANIEFTLMPVDAANWSFTEFSICVGETKPSTGSTCTLKRGERRDFDARASKDASNFISPDENGKIDLTRWTTNLTSFVLHIENNIRQDYFYNIEACKNDGSKCLNLDPVVRNKGR